MKYTRLPTEIEAVKWDGVSFDEEPKWLLDALRLGPENADVVLFGQIQRRGTALRIGTFEGTMTATAGDYVVLGIKGELYSNKPDVFAINYAKSSEFAERMAAYVRSPSPTPPEPDEPSFGGG